MMFLPLAYATVIARNFSVQRKYLNLNQYPFFGEENASRLK
jgi:hypothetical protein